MQKFKLIFFSIFLSLNLLYFEEFLVSDIRIIGLQRVSTGSIFNVIPISVGDRIDSRKSYDIVKSLFSTEQFDDIQIGKDGNTLIITVVERPSISEIDISGNKALKTEQLIESLDGVGIKEAASAILSIFPITIISSICNHLTCLKILKIFSDSRSTKLCIC